MIAIDYTITMGNMIEIGVITIGGVYSIATMKSTIGTLKLDVDSMQEEIKKLAQVLTQMAVANNRLNHLEEDVREIKHYRGFVAPPDLDTKL